MAGEVKVGLVVLEAVGPEEEVVEAAARVRAGAVLAEAVTAVAAVGVLTAAVVAVVAEAAAVAVGPMTVALRFLPQDAHMPRTVPHNPTTLTSASFICSR